jgi:hypothetical protein
MRKIVVPLLVIGLFFVLSAPAPAAEKTVEDRVKALEDTIGSWSFYGSVRYATFYETTSDDAAFKDTGKVTTLATDADMLGRDQKKTLWGLAPNTRIGASVNKDDLGGKYEIGFKDDATLYTRLLYGTYTFDNVTFLVGQDYTPLSPSFCNQAFKGDTGLKGFGQIDETGSRVPQLKVKWNGLQVALVRTNTSYATVLNLPTTVPGSPSPGTPTNPTTEILLPHLEVRYSLKMNQATADIFGGAGSYKVKSDVLDVNKTVNSYLLGLEGGIKMAPVYANAVIWMARNSKQLGFNQVDAAGATFDTDYSIINDKDYGGALVAGVAIAKVTVEAGYGLVSSKKDTSGAENDKAQSYYLDATIPVAQTASAKFSVVPEIGMFDYMKDAKGADQGKVTYAGAKWQVDF